MPPGHKKVLGCAHSGVGGHISRVKRAHGGEILPLGTKKDLGQVLQVFWVSLGGGDYSHSIVAFGFGDMS